MKELLTKSFFNRKGNPMAPLLGGAGGGFKKVLYANPHQRSKKHLL